MQTILSMISFAFVTSASPGPVNILATMSGAAYGIKKNIAYVLGATLSFCVVLILAATGLSVFINNNPIVAAIISVIGSLYLLYLAFSLSRANIKISYEDDNTKTTFWGGAFLQFMNPKAWLVSVSAIAMYTNATSLVQDVSTFVAVYLVVCFLSILSWVVLGHLLSKSHEKFSLSIFNKSMALLLAVLVIANIINTVKPFL